MVSSLSAIENQPGRLADALLICRDSKTSRWCGSLEKAVKRNEITWSVAKSPRVAEQCDVNIQSINQEKKSDFCLKWVPVPNGKQRISSVLCWDHHLS
ncbi:hypothetical protein TNCV_4811571 [Trichonephila clavipes]|nr:hypothetical protein TNCV_4811571 [Trichonephila clavipes]